MTFPVILFSEMLSYANVGLEHVVKALRRKCVEYGILDSEY